MPTTKQRRETARRRLERQIQRKQEAAVARRRRNLVTAAAFGVVLVVGAVFLIVTQLGGSVIPGHNPDHGNHRDDAAATPSASASAAAAGECAYPKGKEKAVRDVGAPADGKVPTSGKVTVNVTTNRGPLTFTLDRAKAPCTVNSFAYLAGKKYYDGTPCHRLTTGEQFGVLQCGDPGGTGAGGPGYSFADETTPDLKYTKGVLAMANSGPNTNGSQFFIVYRDTQLQPNYTVFGTVTKGLSVVDAIAKAGADNSTGEGDGKPKLPVSIRKMQVASSS